MDTELETPTTTALAKRPETWSQMWENPQEAARMARTMAAQNAFVPDHWRGKTNDIYLGIATACACGCNPIQFLQKSYIVHGRVGMEGQLAIGLVQARGIIRGSILAKFNDAPRMSPEWACIAWATVAATGERAEYTLTWRTVVDMGWAKPKKNYQTGKETQSMWMLQPDHMMRTRARTLLARELDPAALMGLYTTDELHDIYADKAASRASETVLDVVAEPVSAPHPLANVPAGGVPGFEDGPQKTKPAHKYNFCGTCGSREGNKCMHPNASAACKTKPRYPGTPACKLYNEKPDEMIDPPAVDNDGWGNESEPAPDPESQPVQVAQPPHGSLYNYIYAAALNKGFDDAKFDAAYQFGGLEQVAIELGMSEAEWQRIQKEVA